MDEDYQEQLMYDATSKITTAICEYYDADALYDDIMDIISNHTWDGTIGISYATSDIIDCIEGFTGKECPEELIDEIEDIFWEIYG